VKQSGGALWKPSDGDHWGWRSLDLEIADELFPSAIQIVDRFHVKEHLST